MANLYPSPIDMMDHQVFRCFAPYRKTPDDWLGAKFTIYHPEGGPGLDEGLFEWMSILQAALRAPDRFVMLELGAGFGRWGIFGALAAKAIGITDISVRLVEAEPQHASWAAESILMNGLENNVTLINAAISNNSDPVAFEIGNYSGDDKTSSWWGQERITTATDSRQLTDEVYFGHPVYLDNWRRQIYVPSLSIEKAIEGLSHIDLIDADLQGAEADFLDCMDVLTAKVRMVHIGTHNIEVEAGLRDAFLRWGWICQWDFSRAGERETPFGIVDFGDGVQTWINPEISQWGTNAAAPAAVADGQQRLLQEVAELKDRLAVVQASAAAIQDRLARVETECDATRGQLDVLIDGVHNWLFPTLERYNRMLGQKSKLITRLAGGMAGSLRRRS